MGQGLIREKSKRILDLPKLVDNAKPDPPCRYTYGSSYRIYLIGHLFDRIVSENMFYSQASSSLSERWGTTNLSTGLEWGDSCWLRRIDAGS